MSEVRGYVVFFEKDEENPGGERDQATERAIRAHRGHKGTYRETADGVVWTFNEEAMAEIGEGAERFIDMPVYYAPVSEE